MAKIFRPANLVCHICIKKKKKKIQTFKSTKNLNIHLRMQHQTKYRILIVGGSTMAISR